MQIPSIRESIIDKTSKVGPRSNIIRLNLGKYSYLGSNSSVMDTVIGNYCSVASYCAIGGDSHPTNFVSTSPIFYGQKSSLKKTWPETQKNDYIQSQVIIGNDVWVGEKCFIKGGVTIGNGAVIGAHSVVTKDVPDYAIAVGSPAKVIKNRFDPDMIEKLLEIKWWNFSEAEIKKYAHLFNNPIEFIKEYTKSM